MGVVTSARTCRAAHEPADLTVRRQRGAHHRHLAPGAAAMGWRV